MPGYVPDPPEDIWAPWPQLWRAGQLVFLFEAPLPVVEAGHSAGSKSCRREVEVEVDGTGLGEEHMNHSVVEEARRG